jgi:DNA-binding NarL/FixJ family response regulator
MLRVLVADDHTLVRESIVKAVAVVDDVEVVAQAQDGPTALDRCRELQPDLVLLDVAMPGLDGLSVATELRKDLPGLRIIMLTMHDDVPSVERALTIPVDGFVSKSAPISELVSAIQTVRQGGRYLSNDLIDRGTSEGQGAPAALTTRERQILQLLSEGQRPGEIAQTLFVSIKTVKNHLTSVYFKLGVETGAQAVAEAFQRGLVSRS